MICPYCEKEIPDHNWTCPLCHKRLPSKNQPIVGHASVGDLDAYTKLVVSDEDKNMIRDKNHQSASSSEDEDYDCAQPYSYVTHENGDRN